MRADKERKSFFFSSKLTKREEEKKAQNFTLPFPLTGFYYLIGIASTLKQ
jgi:hypothetical protein